MKKPLWLRMGFAAWTLSAVVLAAQETSTQTGTSTNQPANRRGRVADTTPAAPGVLPGNGLAQHDFFYAGEGDGRHRMYIVRKGKIAWSYENPDAQSKGEISDATLMSNGNVLFAHQFGVTEITAEKKVVWHYDAPPGTEIHTAQPIGHEHVLFIRNGNPAKLLVINTVSGATEKEFDLPVRNTNSVHGQFRRARLTEAGTILIAHMDLHKVCEYDANGNELWSLPTPNDLWMATPLKKGHVLLALEHTGVQEMDRQGQLVWELPRASLTGYRLSGMQTAIRLSNGDTLINNWCAKGTGPAAGTAVQAFEVNGDKEMVWTLRSWTEPADLGPSTTIQILDEPSSPEEVRFGDIKP
jgi:outer membrane protein assembly factor BamB